MSRELRVNADELGRYLPHTAQRKAEARLPRPKQRKVATDQVLGEAVSHLLGRKWSPQQISRELSVLFGSQRGRHLCAESTYQANYDPNTALTRPAKQLVAQPPPSASSPSPRSATAWTANKT